MKGDLPTISRVLSLFAVALAMNSVATADAGVFAGNGQNLHQITSKTIQLVSIDVTIILGRGPFLFDGTVPGMDRADYNCSFVLRSLSEKEEEVQIGFPVDSEFASPRESTSTMDSKEWVFDYGFIARDGAATYHVEFVRRKPKSGEGEFGSVFTWKMHFNPKETRTLAVHYHIPMSMGLVTTDKDERSPSSLSGALSQELMHIAYLDMAGYITSTGSSWAGNVETATFTVITGPFERYLDHRGVTEESESESDMTPKELERFNSSFPVRHPWWFRRIGPSGWKDVKGGVQWSYKDFKPKDPIDVRYYMTEFPELPKEIDAFLDRFLKGLGPNESATTELHHLREILLATYGEEPQDSVSKTFASQQLWYSPNKDFSRARLSRTQQAVLGKIDARIQSAGGK